VTGALIPEPRGYRNVVEAFGFTTEALDQRVPVPLGMWHPLSPSGARLNLLGPSVLDISDTRAAVLVCYEQLLAWPAIVTTFESPSAVLAIGSNRAARKSSVVRMREVYIRSWVRLWGVPVVSAAAD
jgi:hypothetical protein